MAESKPRLLVLASGTKTGGGSGAEQLILQSRLGILKAEIIAVVCNHKDGGVRQLTTKYHVPFSHFSWPPNGDVSTAYQRQVEILGAEWVALSGWLKPVSGLDPTRTINIHPCVLPEFGGPGMYGHHCHEAILAAYQHGEVTHSAVTMHFVTQGGTDTYDKGPKFFEFPIPILADDTPETLGTRVNKFEHGWQSWVTNLVVHGVISWDGSGPVSVPDWYARQPFCPAELRDLISA